METPQPNTSNDKTGFISKVIEMDSDTKSGLMNGVQYIILAIIPVAIVDSIMKKLFPNSNPDTKGSIELLAEVLGEAVLTLLLLFCVHKVIIAIPTYSGTAMTRINYSTLSLGFLITYLALNHTVSSKTNVLFSRVKNMWEGKSEPKKKTKKGAKGGNKVSVSQPLSGRPQTMPTHNASRADYLGTHQQMAPSLAPVQQPVQQSAPQQQQQPQQEPDVSSQQMYGGPANSLLAAQEPMAANAVLGGGGNWSAW